MALKVEWEVGSGSPYGPANPIAQQPGRQPQLPPTASWSGVEEKCLPNQGKG